MKVKKDNYSMLLSSLIKKVQGVIASDDKEPDASDPMESMEDEAPHLSDGKDIAGEMTGEEMKEYLAPRKKDKPKKAAAIVAAGSFTKAPMKHKKKHA